MKKEKEKPISIKISLNFQKDLWKQLKLRALQDDETATGILVRLSQAYLTKGKGRR